MIKILIIADDFTGALDTGVKLAAFGARTKVLTDTELNLTAETDTDVLVLCAPTRHVSPEEAYRVIRRITEQAVRAGVECIFKKTDSALRGNVGAELSAVLDGSGEKHLCFLPALPDMNRLTREGVQYIDGVPVHESVFGQDPFDPVTESYIPDLLRRQCGTAVRVVGRREQPAFDGEEPCIHVFDAGSCADMDRHVAGLAKQGRLHLLAGCAGLAKILPPHLGFDGKSDEGLHIAERLTVVCGSINPISRRQMDYAERMGCQRFHLPAWFLLESPRPQGDALMDAIWETYNEGRCLMLDTIQSDGNWIPEGTGGLSMEAMRQLISQRLGSLMKALLDRGADGCFMIIGGDTLLEFMEALHIRELSPVGEPEAGVVLSEIHYNGGTYQVLSKSGGFGGEDLLISLQSMQPALV